MGYRIVCGDSLEKLRELPEESVHCIITSPPYYGLRDYGTGSWVGGDASCDHLNGKLSSTKSTLHDNPEKKKMETGMPYAKVCGKCGAAREDRQLGLEDSLDSYVDNLCSIMDECHRVLRKDGTLWLNLGDSYAGSSQSGGTNPKGLHAKNLLGVPWRIAFELQRRGWILRQDIIWHKPNPMPESVKDRCTKSHEHIFLLAKSGKYYYDAESIKEPAKWDRWGNQTVKKEQPGTASWIEPKSTEELRKMTTRNKRDVWTVSTAPFKEAHFATFPEKLIEPCVLAGCPEGGTILDPFSGAATTGLVAIKNNRNYIGIELNPEYVEMAERRLSNQG